jgi:hypothetical protein
MSVLGHCEHDNSPDVCPACEVEMLRVQLRNEYAGRTEDLKETERLREQLRGGVEALRELADSVRGDGSEQDRALAIMRALTKADAITGGSRPASDEDAAQPRWVVGGCYEDNRLRLIEGRALGAHEQLTLVEASE